MGLDIRIPIGLMFVILGGLLGLYGLITSGADLYARSLGINVNLWWGTAIFIFGWLMFYFGRRGMSALRRGGPDPAGEGEVPGADPVRGRS